MSGCHSIEIKCGCKCHESPDDYVFTGLVCCGCHKNNNGKILKFESLFPKHPIQELIDKFDSRIERIEDFHIRNFNEHIESLESQMKALTEMYKQISISIAELQDHKVRQIDENRNGYKRVIDNELRIDKLESDHLDQLNPHAFLFLKTELDKLRKEFEGKLDVDMDKWKQYFSEVHVSNKPYKCPVCEGTRICHSKDSGLSWQCESCEGKGIVWG